MLGAACPRWSAIWRADRPASSRRVATVLRNVWLDTQPKSASSRALRRSAAVFEESLRCPLGLGKIAMSVRSLVVLIRRLMICTTSVSYTHLRAHETVLDLVCRL